VNLLTYSEQFDNAIWAKAQATVTANSTTAPDGTTTADTLLDTAVSNIHYAYQSISSLSPAGKAYTVTAYFKASTLGFATLGISDNSSGSLYAVAVFNLSTGAVSTSGAAGVGYSVSSSSSADVGSGWYRCTVNVIAGTSVSFLNAVIGANKTGAITAAAGGFESYLGNGSGIFVWGADLRVTNDGVGIPAYQRINAATDYDTSGFPLYLAFDGVDDSLSTASVDFSATDKMSVFAGVRKLSDATAQEPVSFGYPINGSFSIRTPRTGTSQWINWSAGGSLLPVIDYAISAPVTTVLSATSSIAADELILRSNGVQVGSSASDQGTGNYGNFPLVMGMRSGGTLLFTGRIYSLIVRGAASNADQIARTEAWVNGKTQAF
jgi:hypothetical protein